MKPKAQRRGSCLWTTAKHKLSIRQPHTPIIHTYGPQTQDMIDASPFYLFSLVSSVFFPDLIIYVGYYLFVYSAAGKLLTRLLGIIHLHT